MTEIETYLPNASASDSIRKANERILTGYASQLLPQFRSKIFGARIKPGDSCIESAEAEELAILISELHSYRQSLSDGIDQLRLTSAELEIVPMPLWCFTKRHEMRLLSIKIEQAALIQQAARKQGKKTEPVQQGLENISPARQAKKLKAKQHDAHQKKLKQFGLLKRTAFYDLVINEIGFDMFDDFMNRANEIAEERQSAECDAEVAP
jgi:hypothetical protein